MEQSKNIFTKIDLGLVSLCVILGILLRIGNPSDLAFINDELSTWAKVNYDSVQGVISNIRAEDSHPVGMYVFVYYWTAIFGTSEFAFKLPFLLMSIASMFLVYKISSLWFSKTTAIFALAFFSSLQFSIWWSTIARQYQSGLFCTLVMAYCWTQILVVQKNDKIYWLGFILAGAAAMYNHYFSLIFAAVIGISGLWWLRKEIWWQYLLAGGMMLLLFAPHIEITQYQLSHADGHKWYAIPTPAFLSNHFLYIFHYSIWCVGLILGLLLISLILFWKDTFFEKNKIRMTALFWFLFPLLFGYFYSVYHSPILRESHLLFSFPYLLFFLLSYFPENVSSKAKASLVMVILVINTSTLIAVRKHFQTMNSHPHEHFIVLTKDFLEKYPSEKTSIILGENPLYLQYYKDAYQANFEHTPNFRPELAFMDFKAIVQKKDKTHLIIGNVPEAYIQMAMDEYPYLYKKSYGINYEYYILSKDPSLKKDSLEIDFDMVLNFDDKKYPEGWILNPDNILKDSLSNNFYYNLSPEVEWDLAYQANLSKITPRNNEFLDIALDVKVIDSLPVRPKGVLVLEIYNQQDSLIAWKGVALEYQTIPSQEWQRIYLSLRFAHEAFYFDVKNSKIKTFFWNKEKQAIHLDRFRIRTYKGNLILYGDTNTI